MHVFDRTAEEERHGEGKKAYLNQALHNFGGTFTLLESFQCVILHYISEPNIVLLIPLKVGYFKTGSFADLDCCYYIVIVVTVTSHIVTRESNKITACTDNSNNAKRTH